MVYACSYPAYKPHFLLIMNLHTLKGRPIIEPHTTLSDLSLPMNCKGLTVDEKILHYLKDPKLWELYYSG